MTVGNPRLAVLIDGDNVSPASVDRLFEALATLGDATVRTVYGSQIASKKWGEASERHALSLGRRIPQAIGTNATDIEMVIGAMDILVQDIVDGFCLVSSDADFTPLAIRLREAGKLVYGCGAKAPERLRNACHGFISIQEIQPPTPAANVVEFPLAKLAPLITAMRKVIDKHAAVDGWATLSIVGSELRKEIKGFEPRNYGAGSLKKLAQMAGCFEFRAATQQHKSACIRVRLKKGHQASTRISNPATASTPTVTSATT